ncbi:MAG: hypothetical protein KDE19_09090, partial [Caldilineaceae bacterium]|nr:hypothetical protein [Caldilineaceae bacterium]
MSKRKILQVNRQDTGGPATIARQLHFGYQRQGWQSAMVVAHKRGDRAEFQKLDPKIGQHRWAQWWSGIAEQLAPLERQGRQVTRFRHLTEYIGQPKRLYEKLVGHEEFDFPATWRLLEGVPLRPDILHLHNLHGHYFDLRALPWLSRQLPVVLTPHD